MTCMKGQSVSSISRFAYDTELGGVADISEGWAAIQQDLDRVDSWVERKT